MVSLSYDSESELDSESPPAVEKVSLSSGNSESPSDSDIADSKSEVSSEVAATTDSFGECASIDQLPVVGPYDLETINGCLLRGRLSDIQ